MRAGLPILFLAALVASPLPGQVCSRVPPPFLPGLFPESALGLTLEFATDPSGGCTGMYRPASAEARRTSPWAVVNIELNHEALGDTAEAIRTRFVPPLNTVYTMSGWPVVMRVAPLGDEFVALKGSVRVMVLVKNGDQGEASRALAEAIMERVLPQIPCG